MVVTLYRTTDDSITINRSKTPLKTFSDVKTKGPVNSSAPSLLLTASEVDLDDANYMYISEFDRYYFITKTPMPGGMVEVNGEVDVLNIPGLKSCRGIVEKSEDLFDEYINDGDFVTESRYDTHIYKSSDSFPQAAYWYIHALGAPDIIPAE